MGKIGKDIRLTFKDDEQDIRKYLESKSSATCFLKDLARIEMEREKKMLESADANAILQNLIQSLQAQAPVFNLTANIEGAVPVMGAVPTNNPTTENQYEEDEEEFDLDISDL